MRTDIPKGAREPTALEAWVSLFSLVIGIGVSVLFYGLDPEVPMLLGVVVAAADGPGLRRPLSAMVF